MSYLKVVNILNPSASNIAIVTDVLGNTLFTGNVGIGTGGGNISFNGSALVIGTQNALPIQFRTSGTQQLVITSTGNVGIANTNPAFNLVVNNTVNGTVAQFGNGSYIGSYNNSAYFSSSYFNANATWTSPTTGASIVGLQGGPTPSIAFYVDNVLTAGSTYGPTQRMIIFGNGNVGIGSTTPTQTLDVQGNVNVLNTVIMGSSFLRNRLINGGMQVWQRGTAFTNLGYAYSADRWAGGPFTGVQQISQNTSVPAVTGAAFQYSLKLQRPSGSVVTTPFCIIQTIESVNCYDLSGQTITLSFWAKAGANFSAPYLGVQVNTGTVADQGSSAYYNWTGPSNPINAATTINTTWTKYTYTGTVGAGVLEMNVVLFFNPVGTAGADDSVYITGVQLEPGPVATPFERKLYDQVLVDCQRYYYRMTAANQSSMFGAGFVYSTSIAIGYVPFPVQMRIAPVALEQSGTAANYEIYSPGGYTTSTSVPVLNSGDTWNATVQFIASGYTAGQGTILRAASASAYLGFSAEL